MNYDPIPSVLDYGLIRMANFDKSKDNERWATHYLMPLYEMDMKKYLSKLQGLQKLEKTVNIAV